MGIARLLATLVAVLSVAWAMPLREARAGGVTIDKASNDQKQTAQSLFQNGVRLFDVGQFGQAFKEFSASYEVVRSPNAHFMMARCLTEMGEVARAFNELLVAEDEARANPKYKTTLIESSQLRQELARRVAIVVISANGDPRAAVTVDGVAVPLRKQYAVNPGEVEVVGIVQGEARARQKVSLQAGDIRPIELVVGRDVPVSDAQAGTESPVRDESTAQPEPTDGVPWFVAAGATGAGAVGLGIASLISFLDFRGDQGPDADAERKAYNAAHPNEKADCEVPADQSGVATPWDCAAIDKRTRATGFLIGASGVAAIAVVFVVVGATAESGQPAETAVRVVVRPNGVGLEGTF